MRGFSDRCKAKVSRTRPNTKQNARQQQWLLSTCLIALAAVWLNFAHCLTNKLAFRLAEIDAERGVQIDQADYLLAGARIILSLRDEYIFVVQTSCPRDFNQTSAASFYANCGKMFVETYRTQYTRAQLQQTFAAHQLITNVALSKFVDNGSWWKGFGRRRSVFTAQIADARYICSLALRTVPNFPTDFWDADEIADCVQEYADLIETTFALVKSNSVAYRDKQKFDSWLVLGPLSFVVDGVQAWNAVARFAPPAVIEGLSTAKASLALQELTLHLDRLYYFSQVVLMAMPRFEPAWTVDNMVELGLGHHFNWLAQALSVVNVYFSGGGLYMPPNWSQEVLNGGHGMYQFALRCQRRMLMLIKKDQNEILAALNLGLLPLVGLFVGYIIMMCAYVMALLLQETPKTPNFVAPEGVRSRLQALGDAIRRSRRVLQRNSALKTSASLESLWCLQNAFVGVQTEIQQQPGHLRKQPVDTVQHLRNLVSQYCSITRSNILLEGDALTLPHVHLNELQWHRVVRGLLDAAVQRAQGNEIHVICRYLSEQNMLQFSQLGDQLRHSSCFCKFQAAASLGGANGGLMVSITDSGPTPNMELLNSTAQPEELQALQSLVHSELHGHLITSRRPDHDEGTYTMFLVPLSRSDTETIEQAAMLAGFTDTVPDIEAHALSPVQSASGKGATSRSQIKVLVPGIGNLLMEWPTIKLYSLREAASSSGPKQSSLSSSGLFGAAFHRRITSRRQPRIHLVACTRVETSVLVQDAHCMGFDVLAHKSSAELLIDSPMDFLSNQDCILLGPSNRRFGSICTLLSLRGLGFRGLCIIRLSSDPPQWASESPTLKFAKNHSQARSKLRSLTRQPSATGLRITCHFPQVNGNGYTNTPARLVQQRRAQSRSRPRKLSGAVR